MFDLRKTKTKQKMADVSGAPGHNRTICDLKNVKKIGLRPTNVYSLKRECFSRDLKQNSRQKKKTCSSRSFGSCISKRVSFSFLYLMFFRFRYFVQWFSFIEHFLVFFFQGISGGSFRRNLKLDHS